MTPKSFVLSWESPSLKGGLRLMLQRIEPLTFIPIALLEIRGTCVIRVCDFNLRHARLGGTEVVWGESKLEDRDVLLVASHDDTGKPLVSVHFPEKPGSEALAG
jgi:hypothetical protein